MPLPLVLLASVLQAASFGPGLFCKIDTSAPVRTARVVAHGLLFARSLGATALIKSALHVAYGDYVLPEATAARGSTTLGDERALPALDGAPIMQAKTVTMQSIVSNCDLDSGSSGSLPPQTWDTTVRVAHAGARD